jgi:hypothetical protein
MQFDLNDAETLALLHLLVEIIEADRYPFSPCIRLLRAILAKFGEMGRSHRRQRAADTEERVLRRAPRIQRRRR